MQTGPKLVQITWFHNDKLSKCVNTVKPAQTTTRLRRPTVSPPKQIPMQWLLYKITTTTHLTPPVTTFFVPQIKKNPV